MIVLCTRAYESLKAVLGRRVCDDGPVAILEASPQQTLHTLVELLGDFAKAGADRPSVPQKQLVRAGLLELAAVALRSVEAIDTYDLAAFYKEQDACPDGERSKTP